MAAASMRALARYLWAAPCTVVGMCLAAPAFAIGARAEVADGVIEIALSGRDGRTGWLRSLPFVAITFGHVVIGINRTQLRLLRPHEHEHVRQYERWGPLFFLAYPLDSLWQLARGRRPYVDNRFEVQARAKETSQL